MNADAEYADHQREYDAAMQHLHQRDRYADLFMAWLELTRYDDPLMQFVARILSAQMEALEAQP